MIFGWFSGYGGMYVGQTDPVGKGILMDGLPYTQQPIGCLNINVFKIGHMSLAIILL